VITQTHELKHKQNTKIFLEIAEVGPALHVGLNCATSGEQQV